MPKSLYFAFALLLILAFPTHAQMPATTSTKGEPVASKSEKATTIYLVRHAEKATGTGDVALSEAGEKRAACLAAALAAANLQAIYTTEYKRTRDTAAPAAAKSGVAPTVIGGAELDRLIATLKKETGRNVLVVGHSNTVPKILERLGGAPTTIKDDEYDHLYVVTLMNGEVSVATLRYCQ